MGKVIAYCSQCGSENLHISKDNKYLICNECEEIVYIKDSEIRLVMEEVQDD